jgi:hypothetical protein
MTAVEELLEITSSISALLGCMSRGGHNRILPDRPLTQKEKDARSRANHLEERRAKDRAAKKREREKYPKKLKERYHKWREENYEKAIESSRKSGTKWRANPKNRERKKQWRRQWVQDNPGQVRAYVLKRNFGITPLQLMAAVHFQGYRCALCRQLLRFDKKQKVPVHVDHDHRSGQFRGVLCVGCNSAIGKLKDDPVILLRAADYVRGRM